MAEHKVPGKVFLSEQEHARLVMLSSATQTVITSFAPGGRVWLHEVQSNAWAFKLLLEWRGLIK